MPSLVRQVEMALLSVYVPKLSLRRKKHEVEPELRARLIFGARTLEVYLDWACRFVRWAREVHGVRRLVELPHLAGQAWVQGMINSEKSPWTVSLAISALRKLEWGIWARWGIWVTLIDPNALTGRRRRTLRMRKRRGAYPAGDLRLLREHLPEEYRQALDACVALGLRRKELVGVRACDVDLLAASYLVKGRDGVWTEHPLPPGYAGVVRVRKGKGGRPREVPVPVWYRPELEAILAGRGPEDRLWPVQYQEFGRAIYRACKDAGIVSRGVHGLRHTWAIQQMHHLMSLGYSEDEARQLCSWWLGHNRLAVTSSYLARRRESGFDVTRYIEAGGAEGGVVRGGARSGLMG